MYVCSYVHHLQLFVYTTSAKISRFFTTIRKLERNDMVIGFFFDLTKNDMLEKRRPTVQERVDDWDFLRIEKNIT